MIEIDHTLLSTDALENLIIEVITRDGTDYGEYETDIQKKKQQLLHHLKMGIAVVIFSSKENQCDIVTREQFLSRIAIQDAARQKSNQQ